MTEKYETSEFFISLEYQS